MVINILSVIIIITVGGCTVLTITICNLLTRILRIITLSTILLITLCFVFMALTIHVCSEPHAISNFTFIHKIYLCNLDKNILVWSDILTIYGVNVLFISTIYWCIRIINIYITLYALSLSKSSSWPLSRRAAYKLLSAMCLSWSAPTSISVVVMQLSVTSDIVWFGECLDIVWRSGRLEEKVADGLDQDLESLSGLLMPLRTAHILDRLVPPATK